MSSKFFDEPFDEETLLKLEIYEDYLNEWIPVFVSRKIPITRTVNIFDYFSGAGADSNGVFGSPLIAIQALNTERYLKDIETKGLSVNLYLNDYSEEYVDRLKKAINNLSFNTSLINVTVNCLDFLEAYKLLKGKMKNAANLVFLDQFGVEYVDKTIFQELASMPMTDLLFFISSSHFNRFYWHDTFKSIIDISKEELSSQEFFRIHNLVMEKYREFLPEKLKNYYLAPFSIKKISTINGLIFGSRHLLGIEKFLKVGWSKDKVRGEANFDIDKERLEAMEGTLFPDFYRPKKIELFEDNLEKLILSKQEISEEEVYIYSVQNGCLPSQHAKPKLKDMRKNSKIEYDGELALTYSSLFGNKKRVTKLIKVK